MNKTGIIYATRTGHSKRLAEAIGRALDMEAESITTQPPAKGLDLLFIVGGIYGGQSMPALLSMSGGWTAGR